MSSVKHDFGWTLEQKHIKKEVLLPRVPEQARSSIRHFELVACINNFEPQPPLQRGRRLAARSFAYAVVTDFSLLLVSLLPNEGVLLDVPLLLIADLVSCVSAPEPSALHT
jgi:hypothetical protein